MAKTKAKFNTTIKASPLKKDFTPVNKQPTKNVLKSHAISNSSLALAAAKKSAVKKPVVKPAPKKSIAVKPQIKPTKIVSVKAPIKTTVKAPIKTTVKPTVKTTVKVAGKSPGDIRTQIHHGHRFVINITRCRRGFVGALLL